METWQLWKHLDEYQTQEKKNNNEMSDIRRKFIIDFIEYVEKQEQSK